MIILSDVQQVVWFVVSDSRRVRREAVETYGDKVLTKLDDIELQHIGDAGGYKANQKGFMAAAGEMWLFSLCDYHVVSRYVCILCSLGGTSGTWASCVTNSVCTTCGPCEQV